MLALSLALAMKTPAGSLMIVGGGSTTPAMVERFFKLIGGPGQPILVMAQMREKPDESGPQSLTMLKEHGATRVELSSAVALTSEERRVLTTRIMSSKGLWFPGGNQNLFMERLGAEWVQRTLNKARKNGVCMFGTSAGAMLMSNPMIGGNQPDKAPKKAVGAGLVPFLVDTHFKNRDRQYRLQFALDHWAKRPKSGIGLSEGEWIIWNDKVIETSGTPEWLKPKS